MGTAIFSFRELSVYQLSFELQQQVFAVTKAFSQEERYALTDQPRRSSRSVGANIAEAWQKRRYVAHSLSTVICPSSTVLCQLFSVNCLPSSDLRLLVCRIMHMHLSKLQAHPLWQPVIYLLVGGWNTVFGMGVYAALYYGLGTRVHYLVLLIPSNILAITNAYVCYKLFVFKTRGHVLREYFRCYVVYGGMMVLGAALLFALVKGLKLSPVVANCVCIAATTVVSYLAHRTYSFGCSHDMANDKGAKTE